MAGKVGSASFDVLLAGGYNLLAAKVQSVTSKEEALHENTTGLGDTLEETTPTGLSKVTLTQSGAFFDDTTNGIHDAFKSAGASNLVLVYAVAGNTIGARFVGIEGTYEQDYAVLGQVGKLTKANVVYVCSGQKDDGPIVQNWTQKTVTWNTKTDGFPVDVTLDTGQRVIPITSNTLASPSVVTTPVPHGLTTGQVIFISGNITSNPVINGQRTVTVISPTTFSVGVNCTTGGTGGSFVLGSTVAGGVGYLEVSELTGPTGFVGKIRHSTDDSTYVDLVTFANVTAAPNAQRVVVAGTINRYLSFQGTVTGAGTITVFAGFSRT